MQVRYNILRGNFIFEPMEVYQAVSIDAKDFILSLLVIDPMDRPIARQAKESRSFEHGYLANKRKEAGHRKAHQTRRNLSRLLDKHNPSTDVSDHAEQRYRERGLSTMPIYK